jgi:hypothetical protein
VRTICLALFALSALGTASAAEASDFTGRIRRIRIREQQDGSNYRAITVTESNVAPVAGTLTVTVEGVDSGKSSEAEATLAALRVADTVSWKDDVGGLKSAVVSFTVGTSSYTADVALDAWTEVDLKEGTLVRLRIDATTGGYTLSGEHVGTRSTGVATVIKAGSFGVTIAPSGATTEISGKLFDGADETWIGRWTSKYDASFLGGETDGLVQLSAEPTYPELMKFAEYEEVSFIGVPSGTSVVEAGVGKINANGIQRLTVFTYDPGNGADTIFSDAEAVDALDLEVTDADTDTVVAEGALTQAAETVRVISLPEVEGEEGDVLTLVLTAKGKDFSETVSFDVTLDETATRLFGANVKAKVAQQGTSTTTINGSVWVVSVGIGGTGASLVQSVTAEIGNGCSPDLDTCETTTIEAVDEGNFQRWVLPFTGDPNAVTYNIRAEAAGADGSTLDAVDLSVTAGAGTGVRKTEDRKRVCAESTISRCTLLGY